MASDLVRLDTVAKSGRARKAAPVGRPRGSNKEAKLAKILLVARRLFAERGFSQTTLKDVGRDAGMTHAALYSYFDSKADLYQATLMDTQAQLLPDYVQALQECTTLRERFKRIVMASAIAHDRDSTITGFLAAVPIEMRRHPDLNALLLQRNNAIFETLSTMFEEARRSGEITTTASTDNLIAAFFGSAMGVALFQYGLQATALVETMNVYVAMLEGSIFSAPPR